MAQKVVNSNIEFAYASENAEIELKKEIEKYFLYQNVVIFDAHYECGELIDKITSSAKCSFKIVRNFEQLFGLENIDALILVNDNSIDKVKKYCFDYNIPYILVLTKICDAFVVKSQLYAENFSAVSCNYPIGIIFDIKQFSVAKVLTSQAIMEISSLSFDILQTKLENIFFGSPIDYEYITSQQKIIQALELIVNERKEDINGFFKRIIQLYLSYLLVASKSKLNVVDNLLYLYKRENKYGNLVEVKSLFKSIILSLEKNFFLYYTNKFASTINYKIHKKNIDLHGFSLNFGSKNIIFNKIDFILNEFRKKLLNYVNASINFENTIKNILADIDIDNLYSMTLKLKDANLTDYISMEQDVFSSQNFLTILYGLGLLNFDI